MILADLQRAFERLNQGESVALEPHPTGPSKALAPPDSDGPWLGLWTSGTTGAPKPVWWRWSDLRADGSGEEGFRGWTWVSPFEAHSFAGVQVALQAWVSGGRFLSLTGPWSVIWRTLRDLRPEALCCTPTFLDLLLSMEDNAGIEERVDAWRPRQITLGGEPLRARVGTTALQRFPETRFTVIYASAELGVILKTHRVDGWFELDFLSRRWRDWRVTGDGVLELRRDDAWCETGDRVELSGDRFRVLGRASGVANVGGVKVALADVEALAEEVTGVRQAHAFAMPNPVTGQVVGLAFSLLAGADPDDVQAAIAARSRAGLPKAAWPRHWECVAGGLGPNAKKALRVDGRVSPDR